MTRARLLIDPDVLTRQVLFAVELIDPITQELVHRGVKVEAIGLANQPIISWSGRFVWLIEDNAWPSELRVTPMFGVPYAAELIAAPQRPADLLLARPEERLMRVTLRPTPAYSFDHGVTTVRGCLRESPNNRAAVVDAAVVLAWFAIQPPDWNPTPPGGAAPLPRGVRTDTRGEFAVSLPTPPRSAEPDVASGMLKVRLQFTRDHPARETRVTPDDFPFLPIEEAPPGRVPEGQLLRKDLALTWTNLELV